jgi:hypothetical protein
MTFAPEREYHRLRSDAKSQAEPPLPQPNAEGNYLAVAAMRVVSARDILRARPARRRG